MQEETSRSAFADHAPAWRLVGAAGIPAFCIAPDGTILAWNDPLHTLTGWSLKDVAGRKIEPLLSKGSKRTVWDDARRAATETPDPAQVEMSFEHKDGRSVALQLWLAAQRDERGCLLELIAIAHDMSIHKEAERRLQESEARFHDFAGTGVDTLWECDANLNLTFRAARIDSRGVLDPSDVLGKAWWERHSAPECAESFGHLRVLMEKKAAFRDCLVRLSDIGNQPRYRRVSGRPMHDKDGNFSGYRGVASNVTEEVMAREASLVLQRRIEDILAYSPSAISLKATDGRYLMVNRRFEEWFGIRSGDVAGKTRDDVSFLSLVTKVPVSAATVAAFADMEKMVLETGKEVEREIRVETSDRSPQTLLVIKFPIFGPDGRLSAVGSFNTDISDLRDTQSRLEQAQKMEAIGQLTGGVAHDFNNLLAVIRGNAELLEETVGKDHPYLAAIVGAANRGADLTQRLLAFSRRQPLYPRTVALSRTVERMTPILKRMLGETIEITPKVAAELWPARVDPGQLENAVLNLAINARDAMPRGGKLEIICRNITLEPEYVSATPGASTGEHVLLSVVDNGDGMSAEVKERAFEPFFTTKEVGKGSGLGLSMVHGIARQSGGHATIYSELGSGTAVNIYLPRASADGTEAAAPETVPTEDMAARNGERILIVEDDGEVRAFVGAMLQSLGYRTMTVEKASQAVALIDGGERFDLVLSDVVLPGGMSGPALAKEIRERTGGPKFVFMSGYPADSAQSNGLIGADEVLVNKPFRKQALAAALRRKLDEV